MYEYRMIQIPRTISITAKAHRGNEAAAYLEGIVNEMASDGWDFNRVDAIGVNMQPGCLGALGGARASQSVYYVVTFSRPVQDTEEP